jgi:LuxR family maltose regulon positive regulatory protein
VSTEPELIVRLEDAVRPEPAVQVLPALLSPPVLRSGIVERVALLDRLSEPSDASVVVAVAPPGYGKSTLLATWAEHDPRSFAWVTLDRSADDPAVLLTYLVSALDSVIAVDPATFEGLVAPHPRQRSAIRAQLAVSVASAPTPIVLVIDDCHLLQDPEGIAILQTIVDHLPSGSRFALAGREEPALPLARWRSEGRVLDIGVPDLRLDIAATRELMIAAGMHLSEDELTELVERTEGWAVGLYLVALARNADAFPPFEDVSIGGDDRLLADYIRSEFLERLPEDQRRFLIRTSVLDEFCGPLCDATLGRTGSAAVLEAMDASNLLLVPLDRQRQWYRYHYLFQGMLRHELDRLEPDEVSGLSLRASAWCEENRFLDNAVCYAQAAGAVDRVAEIMLRHVMPQFGMGRLTALLGWFRWLAEHDSADGAVAVLGAWLHLQSGRAVEAERWARVAEEASQDTVLPDGSMLSGWVLTLRAAMAMDAEEMQSCADRASVLLDQRSPFMASAVGFRGVALLMRGETDEADVVLADAVELGLEMPGSPVAISALTYRATIAMRRDRWEQAQTMVEQSRSLMEQALLQDYALAALVYAIWARVAAHRGDVRTAAEALGGAEEVLPLLTFAYISRSIQTRIELVHAYLAIGDARSAADRLIELHELLGATTGFDSARAEADELEVKTEMMRGTLSDAVHLTPAELRLLPLLVTHLSFREIGEHLFLSVHTVKAEAISLYRKFGVSSRTQAVERAQEMGLLPDHDGDLPS